MIRLVMVRIPNPASSAGAVGLVPDGILHRRFTNAIGTAGHYTLCWKHVFETLNERGEDLSVSSVLDLRHIERKVVCNESLRL